VPDQVPLEEGKNFRAKQQNCLLREENKGEKAPKKRRKKRSAGARTTSKGQNYLLHENYLLYEM